MVKERNPYLAKHTILALLLHRAIHRVAGRICLGSKMGFFKARSTFLCQTQHATRHSTVFTGAVCFRRHQPPSFFTRRRRIHSPARGSHAPASELPPPFPSIAAVCWIFCYFSVFFLVILLLFVLGYCLPNLLLLDLVLETFDPLFVLVPLSTSVLIWT
jgi:hypothetical protein